MRRTSAAIASERQAVIGLRRRHALAPQRAAGGIERDALDLGAAEVNSNPKPVDHSRTLLSVDNTRQIIAVGSGSLE